MSRIELTTLIRVRQR